MLLFVEHALVPYLIRFEKLPKYLPLTVKEVAMMR